MYKAHTFPLGQAQLTFDLSNMAGVPLSSEQKTIVEVLKKRASAAPDKTAFCVIEAHNAITEISNGALLEEATLLAGRLTAHGVNRDDIVLLAYETSPILLPPSSPASSVPSFPAWSRLPASARKRRIGRNASPCGHAMRARD